MTSHRHLEPAGRSGQHGGPQGPLVLTETRARPAEPPRQRRDSGAVRAARVDAQSPGDSGGVAPQGQGRGCQERRLGDRRPDRAEARGAPSPPPSPGSPKIPGSLFGGGSSLVLFGGLLFRGLTARGARAGPGPGLALKKVTTKGCLERGACRPSRPARPGSTLRPEMERAERGHSGAGAARGHSGDLSVGGPGALG